MGSRGSRAALFALGLALSAAAVLPASASATPVNCGDVLTRSTTLDTDLVGCSGDGLVIGADAITVNLNGHLVEGTGPGNGSDVIYGDTRDGVDNTAGHRGVTVENGEIRKFDTGVKLYESDSNRVAGVNSHGNLVGVIVVESTDNRLESNNAHQNSYGVYLVESDGNRVIGNSLGGNTFGLYAVDSSANTIWSNSAQGSAILGFQLTDGSNQNWINYNSIVGSAGVGMLISLSVENRIEDNLVQDHALAGFLLGDADRTALSRNRVVNAAYEQSSIGPDAGGIVIVNSSDDAALDRNVVVDYPQGIALQSSLRVTVTRNDVRGGTGDGISVFSGSGAAVIDRNTATAFGDDGIDVADGTATVSRNIANRNGDYGIEAVPGVDGGGNRASGNGNPAQCLNVSCR